MMRFWKLKFILINLKVKINYQMYAALSEIILVKHQESIFQKVTQLLTKQFVY